MVTSTSSRRRRFMHYDASFDRPTRKARTHLDNETTAKLKKLPLQSRLEMNKKIMDRNKGRRERALTAGNVSDVESLISIEDNEMDFIRSDADVFAAAKPFLDAATIAEMNRANKEDSGKEKEVNNAQDRDQLELEADITLSKPDSTQPAQIKFPDEMFITARYKYIFPLAFFTAENLSFINANLHKFKRTRLVHERKIHVLDIEDMEKKIREAGTGPAKDEEMTVLHWWLSYDNYYSFEASRYESLENSARAKFFQSHFQFFVNQENTMTYFPIWQSYEADLRRRHYERNTLFDESKYDNTWTEIKSIFKLQSTKPALPSSYPSSSKVQPKSSSSTSSGQPFPSSSKDKGSSPRCVGCGRKDHKLGDKNADHGRFTFAVYNGTELRAREGGGKICIGYNCMAICNKGCPQSQHICSLCGGPHSCRDNHPSCARIN